MFRKHLLRAAAGWRPNAARLLAACVLGVGPAVADGPIRLRVVGGLAGITQYNSFEEPFWSKEIRERSGGLIEATIQPIDRSGLRGQDALQLMQLGVVPFGTANLALSAADDPELAAIDLPGLAPDFAALRRAAGLYRPTLKAILGERYGIELLGVYAYPAQVVYCAKPFRELADLDGRRVRTSSVGQSSFVEALGATPVLIPFAETVGAVSKNVVDCAITGTLSGFEIGLSNVTSHVHALAVNWGLTLFAANKRAWDALPADARTIIGQGVSDLERRIWDAAERETARGIACNTGAQLCGEAARGRMALVPVSARDDEERRRVLVERVLPAWAARCGEGCRQTWNRTLGSALGVALGKP